MLRLRVCLAAHGAHMNPGAGRIIALVEVVVEADGPIVLRAGVAPTQALGRGVAPTTLALALAALLLPLGRRRTLKLEALRGTRRRRTR